MLVYKKDPELGTQITEEATVSIFVWVKEVGPANTGGKYTPEASIKIYYSLYQDPCEENVVSMKRQMVK